MGNKDAKYATNAVVAAFIINLVASLVPLAGFVSFFASAAGIVFGIRGIKAYGRDSSLGGKGWSILAIIIGVWMLFISLIRISQAVGYR